MLALLKEALSASEERLLVSDHLTVLFKSGTSTPQGITTVSFFFWFGLFTARHNRNLEVGDLLWGKKGQGGWVAVPAK